MFECVDVRQPFSGDASARGAAAGHAPTRAKDQGEPPRTLLGQMQLSEGTGNDYVAPSAPVTDEGATGPVADGAGRLQRVAGADAGAVAGAVAGADAAATGVALAASHLAGGAFSPRSGGGHSPRSSGGAVEVHDDDTVVQPKVYFPTP